MPDPSGENQTRDHWKAEVLSMFGKNCHRAAKLEGSTEFASQFLTGMQKAFTIRRDIVACDICQGRVDLHFETGFLPQLLQEVAHRSLILMKALRLLCLALHIEALRRDRQRVAAGPVAGRLHAVDHTGEHLNAVQQHRDFTARLRQLDLPAGIIERQRTAVR